MSPSALLSLEAVFPHINYGTKKQTLRFLAEQAEALYGLDAGDVFSTLMEREQTGVTAVGEGAAVPQGSFDTLQRVHALAATLKTPIEFGAVDGLPVDILIVLLSPATGGAEQLKSLAMASRLLRDDRLREAARAAATPDELFGVLTYAG